MSEITLSFPLSIIYNVDAPSIRYDVRARLKDGGYFLKPELHVTLADSDYRAALTEHQRAVLLDELNAQYFQINYTNPLYEISKPKVIEGVSFERQSVITPLDAPEIISWLGEISTKLGVEPPAPFLHVTIATRPDTAIGRRGIGISSAQEWHALRPVLFSESWLQL